MPWTVETLNALVDEEIAALPADMRARLARLANLVEQIGIEALPRDSVRHLEGKLWELRITGRDGISRAIAHVPAKWEPVCRQRTCAR